MVHGIPKRLHCRPRICITPSKPGEGYFGFGKPSKMVSGMRNVIKLCGSDEAKLQRFQENTKTKLQCSQENHESSAALETVAEEAQPAHMSETAKDDDCEVQIEICTEAAGTHCNQDSILENNSREHLAEDTSGNQMSDACNDQESMLELTARNTTPPNSFNSEMEPKEGLKTLATVDYCRDKKHSRNGINVIDESAVCDESDTCDQTPVSWYHKLIQRELQKKTLQVAKAKDIDTAQLPSLYKFHKLTPHFPPNETSESRRISRTERHVQYMVLKENSAKTRDKVRQHVRGTRKPAVRAT